MKRSNLVLSATVALTLLLAACGTTTPTGNTPPPSAGATVSADMLEYGSNIWFIELAAEPTSELGSLSLITNQQQEFRTLAAAAGVDFEERFAYQNLFNGFSIELSSQTDILTLAQLPNVVAVYPVVTVEIPETSLMNDPNMATAIAMTGADIAQNEMGLTGTGIKVGVMDTGIDYNHPDLGGGFGPGFRVFTGFDFVGDAFNATPGDSFNPVPAPNFDPMDCNGHGTHVAGIVGASAADAGGVTGVAPGVTFGAYKVFGCAGSTTVDIMIAAMEKAQFDGMHVLNMSIGSAFQWPQYPTAVAASRLVNNGMVVVASIGNSGASGLYSAGAPGLGRNVIGVASFDNSHVASTMFTISPDGTPIGYSAVSASPPAPTSGSLPMARTGTTTTLDDACAALPADSLTGHAALIRRGTCPFHTKALNAQNAGAAAVVLYNNQPGRFGATVAGDPPITIPVVAISDTEGALINDRLAEGPVTMTWTAEQGSFPNATGGLISSFSSFGLSPDLDFKPDLGAPGGLIRSAYPIALGSYATISGTSMSSPHVAGAVALLLEARPNLAVMAVRGVLQNSAEPKLWSGNPASGFLDATHRQGAGMINIVNAIENRTQVTPSKLALGASHDGLPVNTLTIRNRGNVPLTYTLTHFPAISTTGTRVAGFSNAVATAQFSNNNFVVPARGSATVDVLITPSASLPQNGQYGGYIVISGSNNEDIRVPYAGFQGNYQAIQVLTPTTNNFPWLARLVGTQYTRQLEGAVFTMQGTDVPHVLYHLEHQSRTIRFRVLDARPDRPVRLATEVLAFNGRHGTAGGFSAFAWDGSFFRRVDNTMNALPNGEYALELSVLKALGNPENPAHWEMWTSPSFIIARP